MRKSLNKRLNNNPLLNQILILCMVASENGILRVFLKGTNNNKIIVECITNVPFKDLYKSLKRWKRRSI